MFPLALLALVACGVPCPTAAGPLEIRQFDLGSTSIGESTLVTLPDGSTLLLDVGNDGHDDDIRARLDRPVDWLLITHDHEDHSGGLDDLHDLLAEATPIDELGSWELGGATLDVFLHDGLLRTPDGDIDLGAEIEGMAEDPNAMSTAGALHYGSFTYLFAGDLTGGGKDSPDVESAVAAHPPEVGSIDLLHVSHHGIRSATNDAWVDWLLPDDGQARNAVVGANKAYGAAPSQEVLDRLAPHLGEGFVWLTRGGSLAGGHERLVELKGDVVVAVDEGGGGYSVCGEWFPSTP